MGAGDDDVTCPNNGYNEYVYEKCEDSMDCLNLLISFLSFSSISFNLDMFIEFL